MTTTQKSEALRLADKYEAHGFLGDHRFAQEHWCRQAAAELRSQHARIAELEAQLSAIGAGGVEPLRKARAASAETKISALMSKISTLVDKRLSCEPCAEAEEDLLQFLRTRYAAPAYPAEGVPVQVVELEVDDLIDRLLNAQQDLLAANVHMDQSFASASTLLDEVEITLRAIAATQAAGELATLQAGLQAAAPNAPLYDPREVAFSAQPAAQGMDAETRRHAAIGKAIERACMDLPDGTEISVSLEKDAGTVTLIDQDGNEHENFSCDYGFAGVLNEAIDAAIAAQAKN